MGETISGTASFLLPVGITGEDLAALVAAPEVVSSSVLLVPDHGRAGATADELPHIVNPWAAVISGGAGNPSGDPAPQTLAAFEGYTVLRTDRSGWISFATNGESR